MIHVFHGFLGSPRDLEFLSGEDVVLHELGNLDVDRLASQLSPEDVLIGYSMGGRVALELASRTGQNIKRVVLISAHPGLKTEEERRARRGWEEEVLQKMSKDREQFLTYWNQLPVFAHDFPLTDVGEFTEAAEVFRRFRLSEQRDHLPEVIQHKSRYLWIVGMLDEKYRQLALEVLIPQGIPCKLIEGGHRLFQRPEAIIKVLKEESVL